MRRKKPSVEVTCVSTEEEEKSVSLYQPGGGLCILCSAFVFECVHAICVSEDKCVAEVVSRT